VADPHSGEPPGSTPASSPGVAPTLTSVDVMRRFAPGTLVAGRYRVIAVAGVGGMGVVYRARDEELGVDTALKVLRPDLGADPKVVERFRSELRLAREVTHKNVVRIHDIGEHEGLRFLTMRYVEGRSLREVIERDGPLSPDRAVAVARQVASALEEAHRAGVIHRDLKPGNILLGEDDVAYVTDFGVARSVGGDGLTRAGAVVGTPDYLSPEQIAGDPADARTDLYALGIVLFEMLTGELPFRSGSQAEMLAQRLAGPLPRLLRQRLDGEQADAYLQEMLRDDKALQPVGSVALVGAGPGDPGLVTLNALRAMNEADVILHDRLVSAEVLRLARRDATRIEVGKSAGRHSSATEERKARGRRSGSTKAHEISTDCATKSRSGQTSGCSKRHAARYCHRSNSLPPFWRGMTSGRGAL